MNTRQSTAMKIPKGAITERKLRKLLKKETDKAGSSTGWAATHKITPQAVSAFERQVQGPGLQIPEALGYKPAIIFIPMDAEPLHIVPPSRVKKAPPPPEPKKPKKNKDKKKGKRK